MKIGQYEIDLQKVIGEGSEGQIYNCMDSYNKSEELCAKIVKMTQEQFKKQDDILQKLFQQSNQKNLVHIKYYWFDESTQSLIIIMEKCQFTLKEELERRYKIKKQFSDEETLDFLSQFLSGYQILYNLKILHRDIKPANIMINNSQEGQLIYKLTDFGISKVCNPNSLLFMTQIGTPIYAPPELYGDPKLEGANRQTDLNDSNPQSKRDVFALGLILHYMIKGELPFIETKAKEFKRQIEKVPFKIQNTNSCLAELVEKMIQYDPQNRISIPTLNQQLQILSSKQFSFRATNIMPFKLQIQDNKNKQQQIFAINNNSQAQANLFIKANNDQTKEVAKKINDQKILQTNFNPKMSNPKDIQKFPPPTQAFNFLNSSGNLKTSFTESQIPNNVSQKKNQEPQAYRERVQTEYLLQTQTSLQPIKVLDVIKQYIQETLINYECLIGEDNLKKLKEINLNQQKLSEENAKIIKSIFKYEKHKALKYNLQTLLFHYCLNNCQTSDLSLPQNEKEWFTYLIDKM